MDLMVRTAIAIEREVDDTRNIQDESVKDKMRESQPSSFSSGNKQRSSTP